MRDRQPTPGMEGRVLITPEDGSIAPFHARIAMADDALEEGTPLNKGSLLKDATAAMYGMPDTAVPDDAFALLGKYNVYWWRKAVATFEALIIQTSSYLFLSSGNTAAAKQHPIYYSDSFSINQDTGEVDLVNPSETKVDYQNYDHVDSTLRGKYIKNAVSDPSAVYFIPETASVALYGYDAVGYVAEPYPQKIFSSLKLGDATYAYSSDRNAYPDSGIVDGMEYAFLGKPLDNAVESNNVVRGSYVGTGVYGPSNPCSLSFYKIPAIVFFANAIIVQGSFGRFIYSSSYPSITVVSGENDPTLMWYNDTAETQLNFSGTTYKYVALLI